MTEYQIITGVMAGLVVILSCLDAISTVLGWKKGATEKNRIEMRIQAWIAKRWPDNAQEIWEAARSVLGSVFGIGSWFLPRPISAVALAAVLFPLALTVWTNYRIAWGKR